MADTIFAPATGVGRAAIAIVRLSGTEAGAVLDRLTGHRPLPRMASLRTLRVPVTGTVIDRSLVLWCPGPGTATGEDIAEFHLHGGPAIVAALLATLSEEPGCRPARPGEFTRRAFLNGRMDLAEVEGLADLIDAQTEAQRRQALRQMEGALAQWVVRQRRRLLDAMASAESAIDFSDEADVAGDFAHELRDQVTALQAAVRDALRGFSAAARIREGMTIALTGPPNAGKSTLINALARREVAIVSSTPGTTRDPVAVDLDLDGYLVTVIDTAGLRETDDPVEREGVARARARAGTADLVLWLSDAAAPCPPDPSLAGLPIWRVATKVDLAPAPPDADHAVAVPTGLGIDALINALKREIAGQAADDTGLVTRERHRLALVQAERRLTDILASHEQAPLELAVETLRLVASDLDTLVGRIAPDDVLDAIFARFCIGK